jgi:single-strand DNA-binding protein
MPRAGFDFCPQTEEPMSRSVNKIILVGHVGRDPELRETQSGVKVANLSLATNHRLGSNGESERERTDWHRLTLWNRLAVFADEHVKKGDRLYVEGRIEYDSYERDGVTIPTAEVSVRELVLLSPRRDVEEPALDADD